MKCSTRFLTFLFVATCASLPACEEKKTETKSMGDPGAASEEGSAPQGKGANKAREQPQPAAEGKKDPDDAKAGGTPSGAACLAGKWHYDFADDALETMMKNLPKAKVTKEEGEAVCEIERTGDGGKLKCATAGGKPVVVEVSADQAGMPLSISLKMSGKNTTDFKVLNDKSLELTSKGLGDMKVDVTATLAGNAFPFPATELLSAIGGGEGTTSDFECQGDVLRLRPRVDGHTSWQVLRRMK